MAECRQCGRCVNRLRPERGPAGLNPVVLCNNCNENNDRKKARMMDELVPAANSHDGVIIKLKDYVLVKGGF